VKICIDATPLGTNTNDKGGVYRYIWKLIESLSEADSENQYTLLFNFFRNEHIPHFREAVKVLAVRDNFRIKLSRFPARIQQYIEPPAELLAGRFNLIHGCFDYLRPTLSGKGVVTVHDIRYLEDVEYDDNPRWIEILRQTTSSPDVHIADCLSRKNLFAHLRSNIKKTVQRADSIVTVSEFTRSRIIENLGVSAEKVRVIYPGVDDWFMRRDTAVVKRVFDALGIDRPCLLYVGKFEPQKNINRLIDAFHRVLKQRDMVLVMAGPINWYYHIVLEKIKEMNLVDNIIFTGYITDETMSALYSGASALVFPSLYEGFGLPVLEAMACGLPVVSSNVCSIPEVAGEAALLADPYSPDDIAEKILLLLKDESLRHELISRGKKRAQFFSWKQTAEKTLETYRSICS
jgi:glycosyltransferase involved in cell wall biosynthesis